MREASITGGKGSSALGLKQPVAFSSELERRPGAANVGSAAHRKSSRWEGATGRLAALSRLPSCCLAVFRPSFSVAEDGAARVWSDSRNTRRQPASRGSFRPDQLCNIFGGGVAQPSTPVSRSGDESVGISCSLLLNTYSTSKTRSDVLWK